MSDKEPMPITIAAATGIRADGEIIRLKVLQEDQEILLTEPQAMSLVQEIHRRFPPE